MHACTRTCGVVLAVADLLISIDYWRESTTLCTHTLPQPPAAPVPGPRVLLSVCAASPALPVLPASCWGFDSWWPPAAGTSAPGGGGARCAQAGCGSTCGPARRHKKGGGELVSGGGFLREASTEFRVGALRSASLVVVTTRMSQAIAPVPPLHPPPTHTQTHAKGPSSGQDTRLTCGLLVWMRAIICGMTPWCRLTPGPCCVRIHPPPPPHTHTHKPTYPQSPPLFAKIRSVPVGCLCGCVR